MEKEKAANRTTRTVMFSDEEWNRITRAAGARQARTGQVTSVSDLIREAADELAVRELEGG